MKKAWYILLLCSATFTLAADALDDMSVQLDRIEQSFWLSLRQKKGEYREHTMATLNKFAQTANRIQNFLVIKKINKYNMLSGSAGRLQQIYMGVNRLTVSRFNFNFKKTSFRDYQNEFNRWQKEKAANEPAPAEESGKKKKRAKKVTIKAGLKTVDLIEYERWLAEITSGNQEKFMKARNNGNESEVKKMQDFTNDYLTCIRQLRFVMAKIRQETQFDFKVK